MPLDITTSVKEIDNRSKVDVQTELQNSNPFLANSFLSALIAAHSGRFSEFYKQLNLLILQMFPDTATGEFQQRWGAYRNVNKNPATQALGAFTAQGSINTPIPTNTIVTYSNGLQYTSTEQSVISANSNSITSLSRSGTTASATTASAHHYSSGITVTISGAAQSEYNISAPIIVTSANSFTYQVSSLATTPASGTIVAHANTATVPIRSVGFGSENNLEQGSALTFSSLIAGVNSTGYVQFDGITGGADIESEEQYDERVQYSYQNPNTPFNVAEITRIVKTVSGVTRVFVQPITPGLGQVTVYFTRDNDTNIIPSSQDILNVKNTILTINPVNMAYYNVIVLAPFPKTIDFVFTEISPNTSTMLSAITANLAQVFKEQTSIGVNMTEQTYGCAIFNTIDPATGNKLQSFTLATPLGDIVIDAGELPILGTVSLI